MAVGNEDRLAKLEAHVEALAEQNRRLSALLEQESSSASVATLVADEEGPASLAATNGHRQDDDDDEGPSGGLDRRSALRGLGTAAAAAVGLVAANGALRPSGASAADGDPLTIGAFNSGDSSTRLETGTSGGRISGSVISLFNNEDPSGDFAIGLRARASGEGDGSAVGVLGQSDHGTGVWGDATAETGGVGVLGEATSDSSFSGTGVRGEVTGGFGGVGVSGEVDSGDVVNQAIGVLGEMGAGAGAGAGVRGISTGGGYGVEGRSREPGGIGVYAEGGHSQLQNFGTGLLARADFGTPLRLARAEFEIPPTDGDWEAGSFLYRDGQLWFCEESGEPGTWRRLYSSGFANHLEFITPVRVMNTIDGTNHPNGSGPLTGNPSSPFTVDISGVLPEGATAMYASVTAVPQSTGGWVTAWESGSWPETANLTWQNGQNITNLSLIGLTSSETFQLTLQNNRTADIVIDALAIVRNE